MLNLTKQALSLSADSEVLSLNSDSVFVDNKKKSYLRDSASIPADSDKAAEILGLTSRDDIKKRTKNNNRKADAAQSGRSMIEMLGVLAIIGVLSVGGIAGYSKAMMKFKINKTVDQISQIAGNIRTLFSSQKNYTLGFTTNINLVKKAHLVPDEMWNSSRTAIENAFGGSVRITSNTNKDFVIDFSGLPGEACMELATYDWGSGSSSGLIAVGLQDQSLTSRGNSYSRGCAGKIGQDYAVGCPQGPTLGIPISVSTAADICQDNDNNTITFKFY